MTFRFLLCAFGGIIIRKKFDIIFSSFEAKLALWLIFYYLVTLFRHLTAANTKETINAIICAVGAVFGINLSGFIALSQMLVGGGLTSFTIANFVKLETKTCKNDMPQGTLFLLCLGCFLLYILTTQLRKRWVIWSLACFILFWIIIIGVSEAIVSQMQPVTVPVIQPASMIFGSGFGFGYNWYDPYYGVNPYGRSVYNYNYYPRNVYSYTSYPSNYNYGYGGGQSASYLIGMFIIIIGMFIWCVVTAMWMAVPILCFQYAAYHFETKVNPDCIFQTRKLVYAFVYLIPLFCAALIQ